MKGDLASEAQRGCALDVLAPAYKVVYLWVLVCARGFTWAAHVSFLVFVLLKYDEDPRACFVGAFSYNCWRNQGRHAFNG